MTGNRDMTEIKERIQESSMTGDKLSNVGQDSNGTFHDLGSGMWSGTIG